MSFPIILHRDLPPEARIKLVSIHRRRVGKRFEWSASFAFQEPHKHQEHPGRRACAINWGWKQVQGGLRVATIVSEAGVEHLVLPERFTRRVEASDRMRSELDDGLNEFWPTLLHAFEAANCPEAMQPAAEAARRAKRAHIRHFVRALQSWPANYKPARRGKIEAFVRWYRKLDDRRAHTRKKARRYRQDLYRNWAKDLAEQYAAIVMHPLDLKATALRETASGEDNPLHEQARRHRQLAAVSDLREWIGKQADKHGARVVELSEAIAANCANCGDRLEGQTGQVLWYCRQCAQPVDQDENAATNLLQAFADAPRAVS